MSEWTKARDKIIESLHFDEVTESMKQDVSVCILNDILPVASKSGYDFIDKIKDQAKDETGWCKVRDAVVLPLLIHLGIILVEKTLEETVKHTVNNTYK